MEDLTQNGSKTAEFVPLAELGGWKPPAIDVSAVRERLAGARGQQYWRSLDELANTDEFQFYLKREFPHQAPRDMLPVDRREFMRVMGATLALAGVGGCAYQPPEKIVPYVEQPESIVPGKPLFFSTAFTHGGYGFGVLAESHMGRPIKLEGNPLHPASLGATNAQAQASLLQLYDPDRAQSVRYLGNPSTWDAALGDLTARLNTLKAGGGAGVRIITGAFSSPTLKAQVTRLLKRYPAARITIHEPAAPDETVQPTAEAVYHLDVADRILSLDSDFLLDEPGSVRYAREYMGRRRTYDADTPFGKRKRAGASGMNRLYQVESTATITGASADHRLGLKPSEVEAVARAVADGLGVSGGSAAALPAGVTGEWVSAVVEDLQAHPGTSLVIPGRYASPAVQSLAHAMNAKLGGVGKTVTFIAPVQAQFGAQQIPVQQLAEDLRTNRVDLLLVLGSNPVYSAPADADFGKALADATRPDARGGKPTVAVGFGLYEDETAAYCQWFIPETHYLEAWGDVRAYDGTASLIQPLITPLYSTKSKIEILAGLLGEGDRPGYELVREFWKPTLGGAFEQSWRQALLKGTLPNTTAPATAAPTATAAAAPAAAHAGGLEIVFRPDPMIHDGQFANNGWLQELPKPITELTWDNAALLSPTTAKQLNLAKGDMVDVIYQNRRLSIPVLPVPYQPNDTVTVHLGYGRTRAGRIAEGQGFNAYGIRTSDAPWHGGGVELQKSGKKYPLAVAQMHFYMENRGLVRHGSIADLEKDPGGILGHEGGHEEGSLYKPMWPSDTQDVPKVGPGAHEGGAHEGAGEHGGVGADAHPKEMEVSEMIAGAPNRPRREPAGPVPGQRIPAWGMVIDLNSCIGCNACVIACQSENNIATVGKDQVLNNREMHWIRMTTYYTGTEKDPQDPVFQPVGCMHCEAAPCEPVCPVEATSHSPEGINEMTYNRCIGTRYCENNCPYKVRRFNYFQYSDQKTPTIELMRNPDVTVRSRGVMEKCTYCVQRVNQGRIEAEKEGRPLKDGDVVTACQQVCPTEAIIFGDINDKQSNNHSGSWVRQMKALPVNYGLLTELNTRPRTSYLAKIRNPNPALPQAAHGETAPKAGH